MRFFLALIMAMIWASIAMAAPAVNGLRLGENGDRTRFVIDIDEAVSAEVFTLSDPYRLVIDLPAVDFQLDSQGVGDGRGLVRRYRFGLFDEKTSRLVLDLEGPVAVDRVFTLPPQGQNLYRLVFDLKKTSRSEFAKAVRQPHRVVESTASQSNLAPVPSVRAARNQRLIVIDAGHGGNDPGAPGAAGKPEKAITLAAAIETARVINASGRYRAVLTRDRDIYLHLRQRINVARKVNADLFISLHADSLNNRSVRGATVYTLSETASDREAAQLAARENKADVLAGMNLAEEAPEVANILIDLAQRESMNYSARFANYLIPELKNRVQLRRNSHRFAGFVVLKAPDVPSVLVEMGYMSNREDAQFLGSRAGQTQIANALLAGIDSYFAALDREQF
ncbi:N-acetylmuramoyl-L-alanine amidase [Iodidimonas nitroreducens]|uniref:N-acetylmuramoyl-L-alanine amidase n=1 Tax=Iodidimonas nitroreducens TaxID=1236968 RepID=A0A5A7N7U0_9PROT|nr:N-acetylmuramoyl-L-alanine amidase [Iodidimonas nitroreducens]GAK33038.1 N-acetylmuramoyl-L-alanine amidase AmiC [alpha proteobacterium Q-1]GER03450.1 N-acetylmuramoyl-L-alanine amidase [Iodidimonas nitroreducens]